MAPLQVLLDDLTVLTCFRISVVPYHTVAFLRSVRSRGLSASTNIIFEVIFQLNFVSLLSLEPQRYVSLARVQPSSIIFR